MTKVRATIHVAGTGLRGSGYPNAAGTLRILRSVPGIEVRDSAPWLPEGTALWRKAGRGVSMLPFLARLGWLNLLDAVRILPLARKPGTWVYAPYPSVFLLWWLSWVPRRLRPRVVADAYVSLWDAAFRDRRLSSEAGLASRIARSLEARALRAADMVLVDTIANRDWYISSLGLDPKRVRAIPLALDTPDAGAPCLHHAPLKVLFIGTLVPLHGVGVIADAVGQLLQRGAEVEFTLVGDGQDRRALEDLMTDPRARRVTWIREWQSATQLGKYMQEADVCLGVFGGKGKASRVLPFKVYMALAAGKAVITQHGLSLPEEAASPPIVGVEPDADSLALAIEALAADRDRLCELSNEARKYYEANLSPACIARAWCGLLESCATD